MIFSPWHCKSLTDLCFLVVVRLLFMEGSQWWSQFTLKFCPEVGESSEWCSRVKYTGSLWSAVGISGLCFWGRLGTELWWCTAVVTIHCEVLLVYIKIYYYTLFNTTSLLGILLDKSLSDREVPHQRQANIIHHFILRNTTHIHYYTLLYTIINH